MKYIYDNIVISNEGLNICYIAGIHGNESNALYQVVKFKKFIEYIIKSKNNFKSISSINFLIGLNEYGIMNNVRETGSIYDSSDMNRIFYNKENVETILKDVININDIIVDVHNSHLIYDCVLLDNNDGINYLNFCEDKYIPYIVRNENNPTIKNYSRSIGKIAFTLELNSMGMDNLNNRSLLLLKILQSFSSISKEEIDNLFNKDKNIDDKYLLDIVNSKYKGLIEFYNSHSVEKIIGKKIRRGDLICNIIDYNNNILESISAPYDCIIANINDSYFTTGFVCLIQPYFGVIE